MWVIWYSNMWYICVSCIVFCVLVSKASTLSRVRLPALCPTLVCHPVWLVFSCFVLFWDNTFQCATSILGVSFVDPSHLLDGHINSGSRHNIFLFWLNTGKIAWVYLSWKCSDRDEIKFPLPLVSVATLLWMIINPDTYPYNAWSTWHASPTCWGGLAAAWNSWHSPPKAQSSWGFERGHLEISLREERVPDSDAAHVGWPQAGAPVWCMNSCLHCSKSHT